MPAQTLADTSARRPALPLRPWLKNSTYDRLTRPGAVHCDLYAFRGASGATYFLIAYSLRGRELVAQSWFKLGAELEPCQPEAELSALYWARETDAQFSRAHGALIAYARDHRLEGAGHTSVLCHYVRCVDADPFPRGFVNGYIDRQAPRRGVLPSLL